MSESTPSKPAGSAVSKVSLLILDQRASFVEAKKIATERKARLPSLQEFIRIIQDPAQLEKLRGDWFWTSDEQKPIQPDGYCRIDSDQGILVQTPKKEWDALPKDKKAYIASGTGAIAISAGEFWFGGRLYGGPITAAPANGARMALISLPLEKPAAPAPK